MCQIDVRCPNCGTINKNLYLDETEGRFECENCGISGRVAGYEKPGRVICGKCGGMDFKWTVSGEGGWVIICEDCGHEMKMIPYQEKETGQSLILPVYDMEDIHRLGGFRKKVTA